MKQYRIVHDEYLGYEVQSRSWWWPFWTQCRGPRDRFTNTHSSVEAAEAWAIKLAQGGACVKYLGKLP